MTFKEDKEVMSVQTIFTRGVAACAALSLPVIAVAAPERPTFSKDVAPILYERCVTCHRPADIGPMSLITYDEVRPWAKSILKAVGDGVMPPWHADAGIGAFKNERRLTDDERLTVTRWIEQGTKQGDVSDLPPAPEFDDEGWRLGEPDLVVEFNETALPAGGPDQFYDLVGETGLTEDTWVTKIEVMPGNRKVVHHVIIWQNDSQDQRGWVGAWAAGMQPMVFPEKTGRLIKAGTPLIADMHYHPADTPESDKTRIGLHFAKDNKVEKELINLWIQNADFEIPAGAKNYGARASYTFPQDAYITGLLPHLHYRGKDFVYTARFPDGRKEKLLSVSDYDFNWQTGYELAEPLYVPKGTRIDCVAHWDNSADNPDNPDPTKNVRFGSESYDEMMIGFVDYYVKDGMRPLSPQDAMQAAAEELGAQFPGDVYFADIKQDDGPDFVGLLHLPRAAANGTWKLNVMGSTFDAAVTKLRWEGDTFFATVTVLGQTFDFTGTIASDGALNGNIIVPEEAEVDVLIEGRRVE